MQELIKCPYCDTDLKNPELFLKGLEPGDTKIVKELESDRQDITNGTIMWYCPNTECSGWFFNKNLSPVRFLHKTRLETWILCQTKTIGKHLKKVK